MHLALHPPSLDTFLLEAFLISNNGKETNDICAVVLAVQHGQTPVIPKATTLVWQLPRGAA